MPRDFRFKPQYRKQPHAPQKQNTSGRPDAPSDPPLELAVVELGKPFTFDAAFARRLVRRDVNEKEAFTVRDASGAFFRASVKRLGPDGGEALPYEKCEISPECPVELTLACAVLARQRMLFVAQKATELGVARLIPLLTEKSVPRGDLEHDKAFAWPGQVVRAAKQCRRGSLPELAPPMTFDVFLESPVLKESELTLCLDNVGGRAAPSGAAPKKVVLLVGPEGGFSDGERKKLEGRAIPWLLGGRVLRAETAVLAGLTAIQLNWGDFAAPPAR